jgi:hypothetical protein
MAIEYAIPKSLTRQARVYDLGLPSGAVPRKVGMLANGFPDAEKYLAKQAEALAPHWPGTHFRISKKAGADQLNIGIQEPLLSEIVEDCDAVVIAWGHCGSCTSGIARDAIAFAERGIPSVMLVCEIFWEYSAWIGEALGMSNLARVRLPFPVAGTGETAQRSCAQRIAPEIVQILHKIQC